MPELQALTDRQFAGGPSKGAPPGRINAFVEVEVDVGCGVAAPTKAAQGGRNDPRVIKHQHVAFAQNRWQLRHDPVNEMLRSDFKQAGRIARACCPQSYAAFWENKIKIIGAHGALNKSCSRRLHLLHNPDCTI